MEDSVRFNRKSIGALRRAADAAGHAGVYVWDYDPQVYDPAPRRRRNAQIASCAAFVVAGIAVLTLAL
jgi:hypothetical protein